MMGNPYDLPAIQLTHPFSGDVYTENLKKAYSGQDFILAPKRVARVAGRTLILPPVTYGMVIQSNTAKEAGIINHMLSPLQLYNFTVFAYYIYQPLLAFFGNALTSGFRSHSLISALKRKNYKVSPTTQHAGNNGAAGDFDTTRCLTNRQIYYFILKYLPFDQLIWENGSEECPDWVHVSLKPRGNRKQVINRFSQQRKK